MVTGGSCANLAACALVAWLGVRMSTALARAPPLALAIARIVAEFVSSSEVSQQKGEVSQQKGVLRRLPWQLLGLLLN